MRITINQLRKIIREEIESSYEAEKLNEGWKEWLAAGALTAAGIAGIKSTNSDDSYNTTSDTSQEQVSPESSSQKIKAKVDKLSKQQIKSIIDNLKTKTKDSKDARFNLALRNLENDAEKDIEQGKLGLKTFATDKDFPYHDMVSGVILNFKQ